MILVLFFILISTAEPLHAQTARVTVNDLFTLYSSDINRAKSILTSKGFKINYDGDKFGKVQFYQWYYGRTSHNADAFMQRYITGDPENYNWYDDGLEYIIFSPDEFQKLKKSCEQIRMQLLNSGQKDFTYEDSYIRDPGTFCIYQNDKYWLHFNAVQEADKMVYKVLVRKKPE
jgi:hypothetical protein